MDNNQDNYDYISANDSDDGKPTIYSAEYKGEEYFWYVSEHHNFGRGWHLFCLNGPHGNVSDSNLTNLKVTDRKIAEFL